MYSRLNACCEIIPWLVYPSRHGNSCGYHLAQRTWKRIRGEQPIRECLNKIGRANRIPLRKINMTPLGYEILRGERFLMHALREHDDYRIHYLVKGVFHNLFHPDFFSEHSPMPDIQSDLLPKGVFRHSLTLDEFITKLKPPATRITEFLVMNALDRAKPAWLSFGPSYLEPFEKECLRLFGIYGLGIPSHKDSIAENVCLILQYLYPCLPETWPTILQDIEELQMINQIQMIHQFEH